MALIAENIFMFLTNHLMKKLQSEAEALYSKLTTKQIIKLCKMYGISWITALYIRERGGLVKNEICLLAGRNKAALNLFKERIEQL